MDAVGHQAPGLDLHPGGPAAFRQAALIEGMVGVCEKGGRPPFVTPGDVVGKAGSGACGSR